jgi:hypothetical protein
VVGKLFSMPLESATDRQRAARGGYEKKAEAGHYYWATCTGGFSAWQMPVL